jgi:hypothetical protein
MNQKNQRNERNRTTLFLEGLYKLDTPTHIGEPANILSFTFEL